MVARDGGRVSSETMIRAAVDAEIMMTTGSVSS
jgi:hypothetical protein